MNELESFNSGRIYWAVEQVEREAGDIEDLHLDDTLFYLKYEADKVIAELKENHKTEVKELLCLIRDKENNFNRAFDSEEKEIRHHKYKRCLAMAMWCRSSACFHDTMRENNLYCGMKSDRAYKWYKRWLQIAEEYK